MSRAKLGAEPERASAPVATGGVNQVRWRVNPPLSATAVARNTLGTLAKPVHSAPATLLRCCVPTPARWILDRKWYVFAHCAHAKVKRFGKTRRALGALRQIGSGGGLTSTATRLARRVLPVPRVEMGRHGEQVAHARRDRRV